MTDNLTQCQKKGHSIKRAKNGIPNPRVIRANNQPQHIALKSKTLGLARCCRIRQIRHAREEYQVQDGRKNISILNGKIFNKES